MFNIIGLVLTLSVAVIAKDSKTIMRVYESPNCGCCKDWANYIRQNGIEVEEIKNSDIYAIMAKYKIHSEFISCHSAIINGYVLQGHIPYEEIKRLLKEKPKDAIGLFVPGMPQGSPGMEQGYDSDIYDVMLLKDDGSYITYATYRGRNKISEW
ncbi:hypothetical protein BKH42_07015 [Helicobacter sp. 13S00482-2]|nr:hypothetical protein BKH42_07015 [Helicobacter sp. 13S00482-2]